MGAGGDEMILAGMAEWLNASVSRTDLEGVRRFESYYQHCDAGLIEWT